VTRSCSWSCMNCLLEGYDCPSISVKAVCSRMWSPVQFVQAVGRGVRLTRGTEVLYNAAAGRVMTRSVPETRRLECAVLYHEHFGCGPGGLSDRVREYNEETLLRSVVREAKRGM